MTATRAHLTSLHTQLSAIGITDRAEKLTTLTSALDRPIETTNDLTTVEINQVVVELARRRTVTL